MPSDPNQPDPHAAPHRQGQEASSSAGEFTQIFNASSATDRSRTEGQAALPASLDDDFSRLFGSGEKSTEPVAIKPQSVRPQDDATLIFEAIQTLPSPARAVPPEQKPAAAVTPGPRHTEVQAGGFTQMFTPIAPPTAPPPELKAISQPAAMPSGEFTQFFSAISARESGATALPAEQAARDRPIAPRQPPSSGSFRESSANPSDLLSARHAPAAASPSPVEAASSSAFTEIFQQVPPPGVATGTSIDGFTQLFRQTPAPPASSSVAPGQAFQAAPAQVPSRASDSSWPAFGPPPPSAGTFTDVFTAQRPYAPPAATPRIPADPTAQGSAFDEVFRSDHSPASAFGTPASLGLPGTPSAWQKEAIPMGAHAAPVSAGSGDFTRLMQSLAPQSEAAPGPSVNAAFFASSSGLDVASQQESEYTRVQRASARRDAGVSAPLEIPSAAAASAPGVAIAAPKDKGVAEDGPSKKSKTLVILLVAMNVLLLIALIVIAIIMLRRR